MTLRKGDTIDVHDHGHVRYIDHMGKDLDIVEAARVSYNGGSKGRDKDIGLLRYLFKNKHSSPFEMVKVKFDIKMPIFVARQFVRHRMQNMNEVSARYTDLADDFYLPSVFRIQDTKNKQGSLEAPEKELDHAALRSEANTAYRFAYRTYQSLLKKGVAREMARIVLPVGIYTQFYSCWDLNNLLKYFLLRDDAHAQSEHRDYAVAMKTMAAELFPETMIIYEDALKRRTTMAGRLVKAAMDKMHAFMAEEFEGKPCPDCGSALLTEEEIASIVG